MNRKLAVLDAPGELGLEVPPSALPGAQLPGAHLWMTGRLRQRALVARLGARDAGRVEAPVCPPDPDPAIGRAGSGARERGCSLLGFTQALAARTRELVEAREFPLVLGGHCSVLLGNMLALRSLGRYGLVFVDGGDDFSYVSDREARAGFLTAAGLDLALATGNGPDSLANLNGLRPYVEERHVVLFGISRDPCTERLRAVDAHGAAKAAVRYLEGQGLEGFWIHVDADVLDVEPSTPAGWGSRVGGRTYAELTETLRVFLASERAVGMELTIDDPDLDPDGVRGDRLADAIVRAFTPPD